MVDQRIRVFRIYPAPRVDVIRGEGYDGEQVFLASAGPRPRDQTAIPEDSTADGRPGGVRTPCDCVNDFVEDLLGDLHGMERRRGESASARSRKTAIRDGGGTEQESRRRVPPTTAPTHP